MKKSITIAVMCCTALSSVISSAAYADTIPEPVAAPADTTTLDAMQAQCDALAMAHDTGDGDIWTGEVVLGAVTKVSGPTEVPGTRVIDEGTIEGAGTFTPSGTSIVGDPFRTGGSVNLFGNQWATAATWSDSTYNFDADFVTTFAHAFSCDIVQENFVAEETIHHPAEGIYVIAGDFGDSEAAVRGNCVAFTNQGFPLETRPDWWGEPFHGGNPNDPHCRFEGTQAYDEVIPEHHEAPQTVGNEAGVPVNQDQTDGLTAFEDHGGPFQIGGNIFVGQVVVCISPSGPTKKGVPGEWRQQNGYTGDKCNTNYFNVAPWGNGSQTSNGTYISVPPAV